MSIYIGSSNELYVSDEYDSDKELKITALNPIGEELGTIWLNQNQVKVLIKHLIKIENKKHKL